MAFSAKVPDPTSPQLYVMLFTNLSVGLAFYGLLAFYHCVDDELAWAEPWPKFLCIKGVVFMTFWQGFVIGLVGQLGYIDPDSAMAAQGRSLGLVEKIGIGGGDVCS